jgi:hypothetical protein
MGLGPRSSPTFGSELYKMTTFIILVRLYTILLSL